MLSIKRLPVSMRPYGEIQISTMTKGRKSIIFLFGRPQEAIVTGYTKDRSIVGAVKTTIIVPLQNPTLSFPGVQGHTDVTLRESVSEVKP